MTDPSPQPPASMIDKIKAFFLSPTVQEPLKAAFTAGGPAYLWLSQHGSNAQQIAWEYQAIILFGPGFIVWVINQAQKTKASIITLAAKFIAAKDGQAASPAVEKAAGAMVKAVSTMPGVQMAVDTAVASPGVVAAANDPAAPNVNPVPTT